MIDARYKRWILKRWILSYIWKNIVELPTSGNTEVRGLVHHLSGYALHNQAVWGNIFPDYKRKIIKIIAILIWHLTYVPRRKRSQFGGLHHALGCRYSNNYFDMLKGATLKCGLSAPLPYDTYICFQIWQKKFYYSRFIWPKSIHILSRAAIIWNNSPRLFLTHLQRR